MFVRTEYNLKSFDKPWNDNFKKLKDETFIYLYGILILPYFQKHSMEWYSESLEFQLKKKTLKALNYTMHDLFQK